MILTERKPLSETFLKAYIVLLIVCTVAPFEGLVAYVPFFISILLTGGLFLCSRGLTLSLKGVTVILGYAIILLGVSITGYDAASSVARIVYYFFPVFFIFLAFSNVGDKEKFFREVAIFYCWAYVVLVVVAIVVNNIGEPIRGEAHSMKRIGLFGLEISQIVIGEFPMLRLGSLVGNPNQFGFWGVIALSLALVLRSIDFGKKSHLILLVGALLGVYLSLSRAAILSSLVILIGYGLVTPGGRRLLAILFCLFTLLFSAAILGGMAPLEMLGLEADSVGTRFSIDVNSRGQAWRLLVASIAENPLTGHGITSASGYLLSDSEVSTAHNFYLQVAAEAGLIGLSAILTFFLYTLFFSVRLVYSTRGAVRRQAVLLGVFILMFYLVMMVEVFLMSNLVVTSIWLLIVLYLFSIPRKLRRVGFDDGG